MPKGSDNTKKMPKKNMEDVSDDDISESEYDYVEEIARDHADLSAKDLNRMILDMFPLKTKEEKKEQLKKIKNFKKMEKKMKMKKKKPKQSKKNKKHKNKKKRKIIKNSESEPETESDEEDEMGNDSMRKAFEKIKSMKKVHNKKIKKCKTSCKNKHSTRSKKDKKKQVVESESEYETVSESENDVSDVDEDDDYFPENEDEVLDNDELDMLKDGNMKFNIIFTTGPSSQITTGPSGRACGMNFLQDEFLDDEFDLDYEGMFEEYDDAEEYITSSESDDESEEEEESEKTQGRNRSSKTTKKSIKSKFKKNEIVLLKLKDWDGFYKGKILKVNHLKNKLTKKKEVTYDVELEDEEYEDVLDVPSNRMKKVNKESMEFDELIKEMKEIAATKKKGKKAFEKKLNKMVKAAEKKQLKEDKKVGKKKKKKNMTKFKSLLKTKPPMNEFKYFNGLNVEQQKLILKKMKDLNEYDNVEKPYRLQLIESEIPVEYKSCAIKKINNLAYMEPGNGEYYKIKQWVDTFMKIPFNRYNNLPITMSDGPEKCKEFMENAKSTLDEAVYGLDDAKMQIMQIVGQWISNPDSVGNAIAIQGPMGTGKTTLIKDGISKILNRPFSFLALGGATDSSFLEGHSYTYEGSSWGKIVDILLNSKCMNPVFYFDELDKISSTPKGEEIAGILTHLTDLTQNSQFHDKYFSNIDFNLSKALFIFSYNDESKVNKILLDRMYKIRTKGYDNKQKITIANNYLIPSIIKNVNFKKEDITFPEETLEHIIGNYTEGEKGVRNLKRALEIIYTKLNLYRLMKEDTKLFENEKTFKVEFPHTVTIENVKAFIKKNDTSSAPPFGMYV